MALMGLCVLAGVYFLLFRLVWSASSYYVVPIELMGMGLILGGLFWRGSRAFGPSPRQLVVTPESAVFEGVPGRSSFKVAWDDPKLRFTLYDFRALDKTQGRIRPRNVELIVEARGHAQTPVPAEAFDAILKEAEHHGLDVKHQKIPAGRMGMWDRISVSSSPR